MKTKETFMRFEEGKFFIAGKAIETADLKWNKHAKFEGVELKHIITAAQTGGQFSYHLVKIAPNKKIGTHEHAKTIEIHEVIAGKGKCLCLGEKLEYDPGNIAFIPADTAHEVIADEEGLYLFAKFFPALC